MISLTTSRREMEMATKQAVKAVRFGSEPRFFETEAEAIRFCLRRGDANELWRLER